MFRFLIFVVFSSIGFGSENNLVRNPSFILGAKYWNGKIISGKARCFTIQHGRKRGGCACIDAAEPARAVWSNKIEVKPFSRYLFSGWIKVLDVSGGPKPGAFFCIKGFGTTKSNLLTGSHEWQKIEFGFDSGDCLQFTIECALGGEKPCSGKVFFDDIFVEAVSLCNPEVSLDLNKGFSLINSNIYGQFIEQMGNCIYGGIWAEMLKDRKFFLPVEMGSAPGNGKDRSPWKKEGEGEGVSIGMDTQHPYVGRWSVEVSVEENAAGAAGIQHNGLGFSSGKEYTGYVIAQKISGGPVSLEVLFGWGNSENQQTAKTFQLSSMWDKYGFSFRAGAETDNGFLRFKVRKGAIRIGAASLMPADNIKGFRADTIDLLRMMGAPVYRWPGGNFVSAYNWWEAIGERDKRSPIKNPSWPGIEHNDVGIDEFIQFCRLVGAQPFVVVNAGLGSPRMAAALVEYCNTAPTTKWGETRANNGHAKPYSVQWWGIGNEMYGSWQHGAIPLEEYTKRHNTFADAMLKVDSTIQIVGVGESGRWSLEMLKNCQEKMNLLSEHFYCPVNVDVFRHVQNMRDAIRNKALSHLQSCEKIFGVRQASIPVALDEWNYSWDDKKHVYGDYGIQYVWRDGLGVGAGLCELIRWRRVFAMANWAQTVNVLGAIKTSKRSASIETSGLPLFLFRRQFAALGVSEKGWTSPLDVAAGLTPDRRNLTLAVVNPTGSWQSLKVDLKGNSLTGKGEFFLIAHPDPEACNKPGLTIDPDLWPAIRGSNPAVRLQLLPWLGLDIKAVPAAPYSISLWRLELGKPRKSFSKKPIDDLSPPPPGAKLLMVYVRNNTLFGAVSADGLNWSKFNDGKPLLKLDPGIPVENISLCRGPGSYVLVIETSGRFFYLTTKNWKEFSSLSRLDLGEEKTATSFDPCLSYDPSGQKYTLLFALRKKGCFSSINMVSTGDLARFTLPQPVLSMGYHLGGLSLLKGKKDYLFYYDDRLGTCCMARSGRPEGPFVVSSPPIGSYITENPRAFFTGAEVVLYLKRLKGGYQVLRSINLLGWEEVPEGKYLLPEKEIKCFDALWCKTFQGGGKGPVKKVVKDTRKSSS